MGWEERVRRLVACILDECVKTVSVDDLLEEENLFVRALTGVEGNVRARLERSLTTLVGLRAKDFFEAFFSEVREAAEPFDFQGVLRGSAYVVKVVTGPNAFNSTMRRSVEEASFTAAKAGRPVILTLQGRYFPPQQVGAATWYSAPSSWRLVTGEEGAYRRFRDIVFEEARARRGVVAKLVREAVERKRLNWRSRGATGGAGAARQTGEA